MVPGPASSASPENLLKIQIASLTPDLWSQNPGAGPVICAFTSSCRVCVQVENYRLKQDVDSRYKDTEEMLKRAGCWLASGLLFSVCVTRSFILSLLLLLLLSLCRSHSGPMTFKVCPSSSNLTSWKSRSGAEKPGASLLLYWFSSFCAPCACKAAAASPALTSSQLWIQWKANFLP